MAVADELARGEHRRRELGAINDDVEALLEQADQVLRRIALHPRGFLIAVLELLFGHVAIIALELLLGAQLDAEIGDLALAALAVLAGAIFTLVDRGLGTTPDIFAHAAIELVLGAGALRHVIFLASANNVTGARTDTDQFPVFAPPGSRTIGQGHRFTGVRGRLRSAGRLQKVARWASRISDP